MRQEYIHKRIKSFKEMDKSQKKLLHQYHDEKRVGLIKESIRTIKRFIKEYKRTLT